MGWKFSPGFRYRKAFLGAKNFNAAPFGTNKYRFLFAFERHGFCHSWPAAGQGSVGSPPVARGADCSNFSVLGEGQRIFYVDSEIAYRIFDLAVAEKDLNGTKIASRPIDDRRLGSPK